MRINLNGTPSASRHRPLRTSGKLVAVIRNQKVGCSIHLAGTIKRSRIPHKQWVCGDFKVSRVVEPVVLHDEPLS